MALSFMYSTLIYSGADPRFLVGGCQPSGVGGANVRSYQKLHEIENILGCWGWRHWVLLENSKQKERKEINYLFFLGTSSYSLSEVHGHLAIVNRILEGTGLSMRNGLGWSQWPSCIFTARKRSLREGKVNMGVCLSIALCCP